MLLFALAGALQEPEEPQIVAIAVQGMTTSTDYVVVEKMLRRIPLVSRVAFWIEKGNYHVHLYARGGLRLGRLHAALSDARDELKRTLRMDVDYRIDEARTTITAATTLRFTGGDAVLQAIRVAAPARLIEKREDGCDAYVTPPDRGLTLETLRKAVEGAGEKLVDVTLPLRPAPKVLYACPDRCAESAEPGICPKCARELVKVAERASAGG